MKKALFLDRDGVLTRVIMRGKIVGSPRSLVELEILSDAKHLAQVAKERDYLVIVITNQPDVARGKLDRSDLDAMHAVLFRTLPIDNIEVCVSSDNTDSRRKPNPGMILDAAKKYDVDLAVSLLVGDSAKDIEAGRRAGVKTVLLQTDYNRDIHGMGDLNCDTHTEIINLLIQRNTSDF